MSQTRMTLEIGLVIEDEPSLRRAAEQRYRRCWGDAAWEELARRHRGAIPTEVLAYEAIVACAAAPPRTAGVRVMDYWAHVSAVTP